MSHSDYQTSSRKVRALTQNISLLATLNENDGTKIYVIKGTTGSTYKVSIEGTPMCTCHDFTTRHIKCKHIYYVLMRILNVDADTYTIKPIQKNPNITVPYKLVFENVKDNTFKFIDIYDSKNIMTNITNHIETTYDANSKHNALKLYNENVSINEIMQDKNFTGVYIVKINDKLYELHMKTITKTNVGWLFNKFIDDVKTEKIARFMLVDEE